MIFFRKDARGFETKINNAVFPALQVRSWPACLSYCIPCFSSVCAFTELQLVFLLLAPSRLYLLSLSCPCCFCHP